MEDNNYSPADKSLMIAAVFAVLAALVLFIVCVLSAYNIQPENRVPTKTIQVQG